MKRDLPLGLAVGVGWFLLLLLIFVVFLICLPFLLLLGLYFLLQEGWFRGRLFWAGRSLTWAQARVQLGAGGTLILEVLPNGGTVERVWLLRERLGKFDPYAPWLEFAELDRQLHSEPVTLSVNDAFTAWSARTLPKLAPGMCLVSAFPRGAVRRCIDEAHLPERCVVLVLSPQLTNAVRRSFRRPRRGEAVTGRGIGFRVDW